MRLINRSATFVLISSLPVELIFPIDIEALTVAPTFNGKLVIVPLTGAFTGLDL